MGKILDVALSPEVMNKAWHRLRNDPGCWVRNMPIANMRSSILLHAGMLCRDVTQGIYAPQSTHNFTIDKADGGKRVISAYAGRDKLLQRAVLIALEPLGEAIFHTDSVGYRPLSTVDMALGKVRERVRDGWVWLVDADIATCFDCIPQRDALKRLRGLCGDRDIVKLTRMWLKSVPKSPAGRGRGLPQGMVISPLLCNLYLHDLDMALARKHIYFVRFADDFLVHARTRQEAEKTMAFVGCQLKKMGLTLQTKKTRIIRSGRKYKFLGKPLPEARKEQSIWA